MSPFVFINESIKKSHGKYDNVFIINMFNVGDTIK